MTPEALLSAADERQVVEAIRTAESATSGEIRVHIERKVPGGDPVVRAKELFVELGMSATALRNGVLIYVAAEDHKFAICGDKGIDDMVEDDFWDCTKDAMQAEFRRGNFKQGLIDGITRAGERLQQYFPGRHDDTNELSNEISNG